MTQLHEIINLAGEKADELKAESDDRFEELIGERKKGARLLLEEAFREEIKEACERAAASPQESTRPPGPSIRYRNSAMAAPAHDVFGDAMMNVFQRLISKGMPVEVAHWFAYWYAREKDEELGGKWKRLAYNEEIYSTDGTIEAMKLFQTGLNEFVEKVLLKTSREESMLHEKWNGIYISADQLKGHRSKQEDRFVAYPNARYINHSEDPIALLAVFDGHGGSECSHYAAAHFWEEWINSRRMLDGYVLQSLTSAIANLDARLTKRIQKEYWKSGATAVCCAIDVNNKEMAFAWLGDSVGYVLDNLEVRKITRNHSPDDPEEARRVEEAGGQIFSIGGEARVNGVLNLTRALGDVMGRPMISNEPESVRMSIEANDYLVILACDGISDVFSTGDMYDLVEAFVKSRNVEDYADLADYICREALDEGSMDNLTVVIGFLRPPQDLWRLMESNETDEESEEDEGVVDAEKD